MPMWDRCGVLGIAAGDVVAARIFFGLRALQHRGQESAGISVLREGGYLGTRKGIGLVDQVFTSETLKGLAGCIGIGHVRYDAAGGRTIENAQPQIVESVMGKVAIAHNGDIVNAGEHRERLKAKGWAFATHNDTEVAVRMLANELAQTRQLVRAIRNPMEKITDATLIIQGSNFPDHPITLQLRPETEPNSA